MAAWRNSSSQVRTIPVRAGSVEVLYVRNARQLLDTAAEVDRWQSSIDGNPSPSQRDSLELARYAARRWQEANALNRTAASVERLQDMIRDHPRLEVSVLAVARAKWMKSHRTIGVCTFRRTWCNNIALDALVAHPVLDDLKPSPIAGLGSGLLHHVCSVASSIGATAIWGECTQNSSAFYNKFLDPPSVAEDLIVLTAMGYTRLKAAVDEKWREAGIAADPV